MINVAKIWSQLFTWFLNSPYPGIPPWYKLYPVFLSCLFQVWKWSNPAPERGGRHQRPAQGAGRADLDQDRPRDADRELDRGAGLPEEEPWRSNINSYTSPSQKGTQGHEAVIKYFYSSNRKWETFKMYPLVMWMWKWMLPQVLISLNFWITWEANMNNLPRKTAETPKPGSTKR